MFPYSPYLALLLSFIEKYSFLLLSYSQIKVKKCQLVYLMIFVAPDNNLIMRCFIREGKSNVGINPCRYKPSSNLMSDVSKDNKLRNTTFPGSFCNLLGLWPLGSHE